MRNLWYYYYTHIHYTRLLTGDIKNYHEESHSTGTRMYQYARIIVRNLATQFVKATCQIGRTITSNLYHTELLN